MSHEFRCGWANNLSGHPNNSMKAKDLVAYALHLRMCGEYSPGGNENWRDWEKVATDYLMSTAED